MGDQSKCLTCRILELIVEGTFLVAFAFISFNAGCDIQSIRRDVQYISNEVKERRDQRIRENTLKEEQEFMDNLSDMSMVTDRPANVDPDSPMD